MSDELERKESADLELDLAAQAHLAQRNKKLQDKVFSFLQAISIEDARTLQRGEKHRGALIVLGEFVRYDYKIPKMRQFKSNPIEGAAIFLSDKGAKDKLVDLLHEDGAILIDATGQILAARVYLHVDNATIPVDEECSTRHLTAASFSQNQHIVACFTLSEETGKVRHYTNGVQDEVFDPREVEEEEEDIKE